MMCIDRLDLKQPLNTKTRAFKIEAFIDCASASMSIHTFRFLLRRKK